MKTSKIIFVGLLAGLSMGNESCEQAQGPRTLKMDVEVGAIGARPIRLPTGEQVDFSFVANSLFYQQVMASNSFVITNAIPSPDSLTSGTAQIRSDLTLSSKSSASLVAETADEAVLEKYGFLRSLRNKVALDIREGQLLKASASGTNLPACLYDLPQARIEGEVVTFEATWGVGVGIGYGQDGLPINTGNIGGSVKFDQSRLEMGFRAEDPLNSLLLASARGVAHQSKVGFGLDFGGGLPIGIDLFFKTPLADVVRKAMDKGLDQVVTSFKKMSQLGTWNDTWESRVIYDPEIVDNDTHIAFRSGKRAGVKNGDTFTVTNMHYKWKGAPCESALDYKVPFPAQPIADIEVVSAGDNVSVARVVKYHQERAIVPGAMIKILKLWEPAPVTKKKK